MLPEIASVRAEQLVELTHHAGQLRYKIESLPANVTIDVYLLSQLILQVNVMILTEQLQEAENKLQVFECAIGC